MSILTDFINLFYPNICSSCDNTLIKDEQYICTECLLSLPATHFHENPRENPVAQIFWGRVDIQYATAGFYYTKKGLIQNLIHQLKYKEKKEIGEVLGRYMGSTLTKSVFASEIDVLVPVPLHPDKFKLRGYNQSDWIAQGLSLALKKPVDTQSFIRKQFTETQTKKSRIERVDNVQEAFAVKYPEKLSGKHILLVDDVLTTGATMEVCAQSLLSCPNLKLSIASLAVAV